MSRGKWAKWWKALRSSLARSWGDLTYSTWIRLRGDPISVYNFLKAVSTEGDADLSVCGRIRGNGMKLHQEKPRLDITKMFFTERVIGHWNREQALQRRVTTPRLSGSKQHLKDGLSNWIYFLVVLRASGSWMIWWVFFNLRYSMTLSWRYLFIGLSVKNSQNKNLKAIIHYLLFTKKCKR